MSSFSRTRSSSPFSLRPKHTSDFDYNQISIDTTPTTTTLLFHRSSSTSSIHNHQSIIHDDSPLPTSALPYIYNMNTSMDDSMMTTATTSTEQESISPSSVISTSIHPPMFSPMKQPQQKQQQENEVHQQRQKEYDESKRRMSSIKLPSASDTYKAASVMNVYDFEKEGCNNSRIENNESFLFNRPLHDDAIHGNNGQDHNYNSEQMRNTLNDGFSVRLTTSQNRIDASGALYTAYVICVTINNTTNSRYNIEHRYSQFAKLNQDLKANQIYLKNPFPMKHHWAGRIGNWTPALQFAPDKNKELIRSREKMLDVWIIELVEKFQQTNLIYGGLRQQVEQFFRFSSTSVRPCDTHNHISWGPFMKGNAILDDYKYYDGEVKHFGGNLISRHIGNPISFTLGASIRSASYMIMRMCGNKSTYTINGNHSDQMIPLDLLHQARGLCFLTVAKAGFGISFRGGTGLMIAKRDDGTWTPPSAMGTMGFGWGAVIGGDITNYLIVLNTEKAVRVFAQKRSVNLGAELDVAVGPGRCANGSLNTGSSGRIVPAYAYAHSKGLFVGITLEGSVVCSRPDVNAKFYGRSLTANEILFENVEPRPLAAQPLYDALDQAMNLEVPENGFRPSRIFKRQKNQNL